MLIHGNALDVLRGLPTHSVDSIVTDPPAGINFMGKSWDNPSDLMEIKDAAGNTIDYFPTRSRKGSRKDSPESNGFAAGINEIDHSTIGRDAFIAFIRDIFIEARRVLKPGGHALVWSLPRTSHWTAYALEEAGFEVRDSINHIFGSGMPKSHNISKAIDRLKGTERKIVGYQHVKDIRRNVAADRAAGILHGQGKYVTSSSDAPIQYYDAPITEPGSQEAAQYAGYGTGLKPAHETWWLVRSPISEKTIAENVLTYGTGAINIDASRIASQGANLARLNSEGVNGWKNKSGGPNSAITDPIAAAGRWPANVLLSHSVFCVPRGLKQVTGTHKKGRGVHTSDSTKNTYGHYNVRSYVSHADENGMETMEDWECTDGCPVKELNQQSGNLKSGARTHTIGEASPGNIFNFGERTTATEFEANQGGASRYFQNFQREYECIDGCPVKELNKQSGYSQGHKNETSDNRMFANNAVYGKNLPGTRGPDNSYEDGGGAARFFQNFDGEYHCIPECPIFQLNQQSGVTQSGGKKGGESRIDKESLFHDKDKNYSDKEIEHTTYGDSGGAARFFLNMPAANIIEEILAEYDCIDGCPIKELDTQSGITQSGGHIRHNGAGKQGYGIDNPDFTTTGPTDKGGASRYFQNIQPQVTDLEEWDCIDGCPIAELNKQAPTTSRADLRTSKHANVSIWENGGEIDTQVYSDTGGVSRYFQNFYYCAKPSVKERNAGCGDLEAKKGFDKNTSQTIRRTNVETGGIEEFEYIPSSKKNHHPTVKSIQLMSYLIRMITPTGGTVLDMFGGSGTTALACIKDGFDYILIEREQEYIDIIQARINYHKNLKKKV